MNLNNHLQEIKLRIRIILISFTLNLLWILLLSPHFIDYIVHNTIKDSNYYIFDQSNIILNPHKIINYTIEHSVNQLEVFSIIEYYSLQTYLALHMTILFSLVLILFHVYEFLSIGWFNKTKQFYKKVVIFAIFSVIITPIWTSFQILKLYYQLLLEVDLSSRNFEIPVHYQISDLLELYINLSYWLIILANILVITFIVFRKYVRLHIRILRYSFYIITGIILIYIMPVNDLTTILLAIIQIFYIELNIFIGCLID